GRAGPPALRLLASPAHDAGGDPAGRGGGQPRDLRGRGRVHRLHGLPRSRGPRRHGAVRREVRRRGARDLGARRERRAVRRHARPAGGIGMLRIVGESGVAAGVRRIEAVTGPAAYARAVEQEETLRRAAALLRTSPDTLLRRIEQLLEENRELERRLERALASGATDRVGELVERAVAVDNTRVVAGEVEIATADELRSLGDRLRERLGSGVAVLAARL